MEKGNNKKKKKKLRTLILLLFLTIIMFGTATYAWFTANRVVTINQINVQVEASNGIQISTNAEDWKSVITNTDISTNAYTGHVNQLPSIVTAVSTDGTVDSTSKKLNMYGATIGTDNSTGKYTITTELQTDTAGSTGDYVAFDIFLRVDTTQTIYLTPSSGVINLDATDKGLKNSARIAFVNLGHTTIDDTVSNILALNTVTGSTLIWEPNYEAHTPIVVNSVAPEYSVTLTQSNSVYNPVSYRGISAEFDTPLDLINVVNGTTTSYNDPTDGTVTISSPVTPGIRTTSTNTDYTTFVTLTAGITRYRVYMWIEGQDIDCENNATGSNIGFNVQLSTTNSAS